MWAVDPDTPGIVRNGSGRKQNKAAICKQFMRLGQHSQEELCELLLPVLGTDQNQNKAEHVYKELVLKVCQSHTHSSGRIEEEG